MSSEEVYACLPDGAKTGSSFFSMPMQQHQPNHLYQIGPSTGLSPAYTLAFSSAADMTSLFDLHQHLQMQPQQQHISQIQSFHHTALPDFDLFGNMAEPPSVGPSSTPASAALYQLESAPFPPNAAAPGLSDMMRLQDSSVQDWTNLRLFGTAPSLSPPPSSSMSSPPHSASSSAVSSPLSTDFEEAMSMSMMMVPVIACASCKRSHIKCDSGRPCQNCLKHPSKALTCRDAIPKPRGRPKGGSKAAAEAIFLARMQQQHLQQHQQMHEQQQHHQLHRQYQYQHPQQQYPQQHQSHGHSVPRPKVTSLSQQSRSHLPMLQLSQLPRHSHPYQRPHQAHLLSRSSPTSPAAVEHRGLRHMRRPSLPTWHHVPYSMTNSSIQSSGRHHHPSMFPGRESPVAAVSHDMMRPLSACSVLPSSSLTQPYQYQNGSQHHGPHEIPLSMSGLHSHSEYPSVGSSTVSSPPCSSSMATELCPRQLQQELYQLQMASLATNIKSEPKELNVLSSDSSSNTTAAKGSGSGTSPNSTSTTTSPSSNPALKDEQQQQHPDPGMASLLQQQQETQAELQRIQQRQHQLQEQFQKQQALVSLRKQQQAQQQQQKQQQLKHA